MMYIGTAAALGTTIGSMLVLKYGMKKELLFRYSTPNGRPSAHVKSANPGTTAVNYLKAPSGADSIVRVVSYDFPECEYNIEPETPWVKWLREAKGKGAKILVVGGPEIKAKAVVDKLIEDKVIDKLVLVDTPESEHYVTITKPQQLWEERHHLVGNHAEDCFYYKDNEVKASAFLNINNHVDNLISSGKEYR